MGMMLRVVRLLGRMMPTAATAATVVWLVVVRLLVVVRCPVARQVASRMVRVGTTVGIGVMLLVVGMTAIRLGEPAGTLGQVHVAVAMMVAISMGRRIIAAVIIVLVQSAIRSLLPAVAAPILRTVMMRRTVGVRRHRQLLVVVAAVGRRPLVIRGMHGVIADSAAGRVLERSLVVAQRHRAGTVITAGAAAAVGGGLGLYAVHGGIEFRLYGAGH